MRSGMTVHRSRRDGWLIGVLAGSAVASWVAAIAVVWAGVPNAWMTAALVAGLGTLLPVWLLVSTRYTIDGDTLLVQCGGLRWRIPVAEITAVTPTTSALSSPALSLDRLRIDYGHGKSLMVSPQDKEAFLREIEMAGRSGR